MTSCEAVAAGASRAVEPRNLGAVHQRAGATEKQVTAETLIVNFIGAQLLVSTSTTAHF